METEFIFICQMPLMALDAQQLKKLEEELSLATKLKIEGIRIGKMRGVDIHETGVRICAEDIIEAKIKASSVEKRMDEILKKHGSSANLFYKIV